MANGRYKQLEQTNVKKILDGPTEDAQSPDGPVLNNYAKKYLVTFAGRISGSVPSDDKCLICSETIKEPTNKHYLDHYRRNKFDQIGVSPLLNAYYKKNIKGNDKLCFYLKSKSTDVKIVKIQYRFREEGPYAKQQLFGSKIKYPVYIRSDKYTEVFSVNDLPSASTQGTIYIVLHLGGKENSCCVECIDFKVFFEGTTGETCLSNDFELKNYPAPDKMSLKENSKYLQSTELTEHNTETFFKNLLEFEDVAVLEPYNDLCITYTCLYFLGAAADRMNQYRVKLPDSPKEAKKFSDIIKADDEAVVLVDRNSLPIFLLRGGTRKYATDPERTYYGIVTKVDKTDITLELPDVLGTANIMGTTVTFQPCRLPIRYQYRALELLAADQAVRKFLFPANVFTSNASSSIALNLFNPEIGSNQEQLQAVKNIVADLDPISPYIIFGPPGTGKTTTIVESILQLRLKNPANRILVTAASNSACNTVATRLCEHFNKTARADKSLELLRIFSKSISRDISSVDPVLRDYSNCCSGKKHHFPGVREISSYGIVVASLCTVAKLVSEGFTFTHAFIDEAGATSEPETLLGIVGMNSGTRHRIRVILSGDHKQLGAVLMSKESAALGLQVSMMERLLELNCYKLRADGSYDPTIQTRLRRNYRSHPAIVQLYNHLFYNNELLAAGKGAHINKFSNLSIVPNNNFPIIFVPVHGRVLQKPPSKSSYNQDEIDEVKKHIKILLSNNVQLKDIGVITPYRLQSSLLSEEFVNCGWKDIEVGSVEKFQGQEKPIIIASFVRSFSGLGFVGEPRRLNVLLSRAQSLLILIGNPKTLSKNTNFKYIIRKCEEENNVRNTRKPRRGGQEYLVTDLNDDFPALHL